jgi:hypothetical protein
VEGVGAGAAVVGAVVGGDVVGVVVGAAVEDGSADDVVVERDDARGVSSEHPATHEATTIAATTARIGT